MSDAGSARSIEAKRLQLNLKVLQRHDPSIVEILDSTSYVVLYKYVPAPVPNDMDSEDSPPGMQWVKTSIEGSMFIFRRSEPPVYGFFILNRHGVENFSHYLEDEANLELTPEYIIVQSEDDQIKGIWVFEKDHRDRLGQKMLELSRLSKHGTTLSKAVASVPSHASNNSPSSVNSTMPLPAGQSIPLDMLFGSSSSNNNGHQGSSSANEPNLWEQQGSAGSVPVNNATNPPGPSLLDTLFADMSGTADNAATARPSPNRANVPLANTSSADEDALRNLLGLGSASPRHSKPSPGAYQQHQLQQQQRQSPRNASSGTPPIDHYLAQSQGPQYRQPQTILEPLAPRPQKLAQFDSVAYEPPVQQQQQQHHQQQIYQQQPSHMEPFVNQHPLSIRYQNQPSGPPPPPHLVPHHDQAQQHYQPPPPQQQQQRQAPQSNQPLNSAPLMPSVVLNKKSGQQPSPQGQQRNLPSQAPQPQQQQQSPTYNQQYPPLQQQQPQQPTQVPQYSPSNPSLNRYGPPPVLRVKSPLRQSQTFSYASSDYSSNPDTRFGAQSIPPPPVPPVESRPSQPHQQQQPSQQRKNSGERVQQTLSPRGSPQRLEHALSASHAMDALNDSLKKTSLYNNQGNPNMPPPFNQPVPLDRESFRGQLYKLVQDQRFFEGLYSRYLDHLEGR